MTTSDLCRNWTDNDRRLCALPRGHKGTCLAVPIPWPRRDITPANPDSRKARA